MASSNLASLCGFVFTIPHLPMNSHQQANSECATAESETVNLIAGLIVPADEGVEVFDVLPNTDAERAAERSDWLEVLGADPVIVIDDLLGIFRIGWRRDVDRLIEPPDVCL